MATVAESGRLEETSFPRLLLDLHRARFGGALLVTRERTEKRFLFLDGVPVYAESNLASESLGVRLMDAGKLSRADYHRVVTLIDESGCKEGAALLQLGLLAPKELFEALKGQLRMRIVECFGWPQGGYELDASAEPPAESAPFRADVHALIQEGIETHWASDRILMALAESMELYPRRSKHFDRVTQRLERDPEIEALLDSLDGSRTLWQLVQRASPRALATAWVLDASGAVDYGETATAGGEHAVADEVEIVIESPADAAPAASAREVRRGRARTRAPIAVDEVLDREIEEKYAKLRELSHYEILGLSTDADTADVKRAYLIAAKRYHPDALARAGLVGERREQANRVFAAVSKAHAVLSDPGRREEYDYSQRHADSDLDANRLAQAETLYRKAEVMMRLGNFRGALEFLEPCVELWPNECAYQSALGWALFKNPASDTERARRHLETAAGLDPGDADTQLRLSTVLKALGDHEGARDAAARAQHIS